MSSACPDRGLFHIVRERLAPGRAPRQPGRAPDPRERSARNPPGTSSRAVRRTNRQPAPAPGRLHRAGARQCVFPKARATAMHPATEQDEKSGLVLHNTPSTVVRKFPGEHCRRAHQRPHTVVPGRVSVLVLQKQPCVWSGGSLMSTVTAPTRGTSLFLGRPRRGWCITQRTSGPEVRRRAAQANRGEVGGPDRGSRDPAAAGGSAFEGASGHRQWLSRGAGSRASAARRRSRMGRIRDAGVRVSWCTWPMRA